MVNKIGNYLIWALVIAVAAGIVWLIAEPIIWWTEKSETRLYVRLFLIMFAISTFAVLRLYNSIVQNTRFTWHLRETLTKVANLIPGIERSMKNINSSMGNARSSVDSLNKTMSGFNMKNGEKQ